MKKYRRKQQIIECEQYHDGDSAVKGLCLCNECHLYGAHVHTMHNNQPISLIDGDWILPEPDGEHFYPVAKDVFEKSYSEVLGGADTEYETRESILEAKVLMLRIFPPDKYGEDEDIAALWEILNNIFSQTRLRDELENQLAPKHMNDIFTWKQIEDALFKILES